MKQRQAVAEYFLKRIHKSLPGIRKIERRGILAEHHQETAGAWFPTLSAFLTLRKHDHLHDTKFRDFDLEFAVHP
jgi:hypothetical protein